VLLLEGGGFGQGAGRGTGTSCRRISDFGIQPDQIEILKERVGFLKEYMEKLRKRKS